MLETIKTNVRSIVLSYVRAFVALFTASLTGALGDPGGAVVSSLALAAAWSAIPAGLRTAEALFGVMQPTNLWARVALSFLRAVVATGLLYLVGPADSAKPALVAFVVALGPAALRVLQELLDSTAPPTALARKGKTVIDVNGVQIT